jgi:hypothetical protein
VLPASPTSGIQEALPQSWQAGTRGTLVVRSMGNTLYAYRISNRIWLFRPSIPVDGAPGRSHVRDHFITRLYAGLFAQVGFALFGFG